MHEFINIPSPFTNVGSWTYLLISSKLNGIRGKLNFCLQTNNSLSFPFFDFIFLFAGPNPYELLWKNIYACIKYVCTKESDIYFFTKIYGNKSL